MYSIHNEGKSAAAEIHIRTLRKQHLQICDFDTKKRVR